MRSSSRSAPVQGEDIERGEEVGGRVQDPFQFRVGIWRWGEDRESRVEEVLRLWALRAVVPDGFLWAAMGFFG